MKKLYFLILVLLGSHSLFAQTIRYVTPTGSGTGTGSWANASSDLQGMIDELASLDATTFPDRQIWVSAGTYYPTQNVAATVDNRDKAFVLKNGVNLFGGYNSTTGVRDHVNNISILSGDLGTIGDKNDNSYHVVTARVDDLSSAKVIVDGFTISNGNANGTGSVTAGFVLNRYQGGAINLRGTGASKRIEFRNLIITNNESTGFGGAVYAHISLNANDTETLLFDNVKFEANSAGDDGGAIYFLRGTNSPSATIINSSFVGNLANGNEGGAIFSNSSSTKLTITGCTFEGNKAATGGAINAAGVTNITSSVFKDNESSGSGSAVYLVHSALSSTIEKTSFEDNISSGNYGAVYFSSGTTTLTGKLIISASKFMRNVTSAGSGGALFVYSGEVNVANSLFAQNESNGSGGGAIYIGSGTATPSVAKLINNTFYGNLANGTGVGGAVAYFNNSTAVNIEFNNNIFNANSAGGSGDDTRSPLLAAGSYKNNLFQITRANNGSNLIGNVSDASPAVLFESTDALSSNFLKLVAGSIALNAGDNLLISGGLDLDGNSRIRDVNVDMGAYELQIGDDPLPVALTSFSVAKKGSTSVLTWKTESEQNNQKFVIERGSSATNFTFFKEVAGAGNSSAPLSYTVTDFTPLAGNNYYRLTQYDNDGTSKILGVEAVKFELTAQKTSIYPNPASSYVKVNSNAAEGIVSLNLISLTGKTILTNNYAQLANESVKLELANIPTGTYILWINKGKPNAEKQTLLVVK